MAGKIGGICTSSSAYMPCGLPVHVHSPCSLNRLGWSCCIEDLFVCMSFAAMHYGLTQRGGFMGVSRSLPVLPLPGLLTSYAQLPCGPVCPGRSSLPQCYT